LLLNIQLEVNMMRRRAIGRPIARAVVGTAVVAGTAGVVHHAQHKHWQKQEAQQQQAYDQAYQQGAADAQAQQQYAPPPQQYAPPPPPAPAQDDLTSKLQQLAQLHNSGVLTDEEFAAAKQKLLAG
jgi:hypothetical protein